MRHIVRIALMTAALTVGFGEARAQQPGCETGGCSSCGGGCDPCGGSHLGHKTKRFFDWLIYVPLDHGKTKCCHGCQSCRPPAWVFFPCEGGTRACGNCGGGPGAGMMYYAKGPATTTATVPAGQVVQTAYGAPKPATTGAEKRLSTYKPASIAGNMPALAPEQFRKALPAGTCANCNK